MDIDWLSRESHVLLNPRMPDEEQRRLRSLATDLPGHLWLATSGSTGAIKLTALSKEAMLASAAAVNRFLQSDATDVWLGVLPVFHVGGLGIHARAFLSGARVTAEWSDDVTLASLVPAQLRDLIGERRTPPPALRALIIGGGAVSEELYREAAGLGWPVRPSYGMTETCSMVATAEAGSPVLRLLDHVEARVADGGRLAFRGSSLLSGYATENGFVDPKVDGWFITEDLGEIRGNLVVPLGRRGDFVKIGGESVDLARLDAIVERIAGRHAAVVAVPDVRLDAVIHLVVEAGVDAAGVRDAFDERVHPFERARQVHVIATLPRSPLGKLLRNELLRLVSEAI